jgi:TetR/AcrR family transcriptional repressor of nem operon
MTQELPMRDKIIAAAEKRVRNTGFPAMSFRDIAQDVGIKSASVHYHFPTKADLGEAILDRYSEKFQTRLNEIDQTDLYVAIAQFIQLYGDALVVDEAICLCAVLGAEALGLPTGMNDRTKAFFEMNFEWLNTLFAIHGFSEKSDLALLVVTALEGAIIVSSAAHDRKIFDRVAQQTQATVLANFG